MSTTRAMRSRLELARDWSDLIGRIIGRIVTKFAPEDGGEDGGKDSMVLFTGGEFLPCLSPVLESSNSDNMIKSLTLVVLEVLDSSWDVRSSDISCVAISF